jgi:thioredoxin-related protein
MTKYRIIFFAISMLICMGTFAQQPAKIYNPAADAKADVAAALVLAKAEGKQVFLQIGGNWCPWCVRFTKLVHEDARLDSLMKADYEVVKVNYSKENENRPLLATLDYPQRFGFPVIVILDGNGKRIHTQDSGLLEDGAGSYGKDKIATMLTQWSTGAMRKTMEKFK